jgi:hypothetical protein
MRLARAAFTIVLSLVLFVVSGVASLVVSIAGVVGACWLAGVDATDPDKGYWMWGILISPVVWYAAIYTLGKALKRRELRLKAEGADR